MTPNPDFKKPAWAKDSDLLPVFPKAAPAHEFQELKILQANGSPFREPVEDWAGARQRASGGPRWNQWLVETRAAADSWMARHRDRATWEAGWAHNFVSPTSGSSLKWEEKVPGEETDHLLSKEGERVEITPKIFGGWVYGFRQRHLEVMRTAARLYRLTGETTYLDWAAGQLDFYAENYERWPITTYLGNPARLGYQSLDDAVMLTVLTDTARLLAGEVSPSRLAFWRDHLFMPEAALLEESFHLIHNIALWLRVAQAQVALLFSDTPLWERAVEGEYGVRRQLLRGVTSDYFWYEQSMGYNDYVAEAMRNLLFTAGLLGHGPRLAEEAATTQNLLLAPLAIRFPDGTLPNPADSGPVRTVPSPMLGKMYRILPTTVGLRQVADTLSWDTLVEPPESIADLADAEAAELPTVVSRAMESSGFALLKQDRWQVFLHFGQVNRSHAQSEALNWSASFDGVSLTFDTGSVGYGSPLHRGYYTRGLHHNLPLVNGEGQSGWQVGELTEFDAAARRMCASQPNYRPGAEARRTLSIQGDQLIDDVTLKVTQPATLGLSLHLEGEILAKSLAPFQPAPDFAKGRPEPFTYWTEVQSAEFEDAAALQVRLPGNSSTMLKVEFRVSGPFRLFQGSSPGAPPARRNGLYLDLIQPASEASFRTTISPA